MRGIKETLCVLVLLVLMSPLKVGAQSTSPNYQVNEYLFGAGGELELSSPAYKARAAAGELGVGNISSPNYQAYSGFNTTDVPLLEVSVTGGTFNLGTLDVNAVKAGNTTFTTRDYLSSGYTVQVLGQPPKNASGTTHTLTNMSTAGVSSPGTEQFGINLAANNLSGPGAFGAIPSQVPDASFGFGTAISPYNVTNQFKYVEGDTVAQSTKSSGTTQFTLSWIANISTTTPGGSYGTSLFVRVVPTF